MVQICSCARKRWGKSFEVIKHKCCWVTSSKVDRKGETRSIHVNNWLARNVRNEGSFIPIITIPRTQMTHILEDLTHKIEGEPPKKWVGWVPGIYSLASFPQFPNSNQPDNHHPALPKMRLNGWFEEPSFLRANLYNSNDGGGNWGSFFSWNLYQQILEKKM